MCVEGLKSSLKIDRCRSRALRMATGANIAFQDGQEATCNVALRGEP